MRHRLVIGPALVVTALVASACSSDGSRATTRPSRSSSTTTTTAAPTSTTAAPDPHRARFTLTKIAPVEAPTAMASRPGDDALYVTAKAGRVRVIRTGALDPTPVIALRAPTASAASEACSD